VYREVATEDVVKAFTTAADKYRKD
jgi:hypothetical protein